MDCQVCDLHRVFHQIDQCRGVHGVDCQVCDYHGVCRQIDQCRGVHGVDCQDYSHRYGVSCSEFDCQDLIAAACGGTAAVFFGKDGHYTCNT